MKLRAIALIAFLFVLTVAANAQTTRADLPPPDNFLGIATFPLWDGDAPGALGKNAFMAQSIKSERWQRLCYGGMAPEFGTTETDLYVDVSAR